MVILLNLVKWCMVVVTGCQVASHSENGIYVSLRPVVCTVVDDG